MKDEGPMGKQVTKDKNWGLGDNATIPELNASICQLVAL